MGRARRRISSMTRTTTRTALRGLLMIRCRPKLERTSTSRSPSTPRRCGLCIEPRSSAANRGSRACGRRTTSRRFPTCTWRSRKRATDSFTKTTSSTRSSRKAGAPTRGPRRSGTSGPSSAKEGSFSFIASLCAQGPGPPATPFAPVRTSLLTRERARVAC